MGQTSMTILRRFRYTLRVFLFGMLFMLGGCFQPAGSDLQPTTVDLLDLTAIATEPPTPTPTVFAEPTAIASPMPLLPTETSAVFAEPTDVPTPLPPADLITSPTPIDMFPSATLPGDSPFQFTVTPAPPAVDETPAVNSNLLPTPTALPTSDPCFYIVQPGEWPYAIARKLQIDAQALINANPWIATGQLQPGDRLTVPDCQPAPTPTPPPPAPAGAQSDTQPGTSVQGVPPTPIPVLDRIYTVADGDTLGAIARKFNTTVRELQMVNNLREGDFIRAGQQLRIPQPAQ